MLDFLQKMSHQHHTPLNEAQVQKKQSYDEFSQQMYEEPINKQYKQNQKAKSKQLSASKVLRKNLTSLTAQLQAGEVAQLDSQVLGILQQLKQESQKSFSEEMMGMIQAQRTKVERKVYLREMSDDYEQYLQEILLQSSSSNRFIRNGIADMFNNLAYGIMNDIMYTNKYNLVKRGTVTKDDLKILQNSLNKIKNNEGNIREKVGELKLQLKNEAKKINNRSLEIINRDAYDVNHFKTKEVEQFIKSIQEERFQRKKRKQESVMRRKQKQQRKAFQIEMERTKAKSERHQRLVQAYNEKRKMKYEEKMQQEMKNEDFKQWMTKVYQKKVPLYKQKEYQFFEKFIKQQHQEKLNKLLRRREQYASLDMDNIHEHQQKYLEFKKNLQLENQAEWKMRKEQQKKIRRKLNQMHKGQFRYYVLEEMVAKKEEQEKDPLQEITLQKKRQKEYSRIVKQFFKPKVDPAKRMQSQNILNSSRSKKKRGAKINRMDARSLIESNYENVIEQQQSEQEKNPKTQGQKYRRYMKQYIQDKIERGEIKRTPDEKQRSTTLQPRPNYLQQLRSLRESRMRKYDTISMDQSINSISQKKDVTSLMTIAEQNDQKAQRLEQKLRLSQHKPQEVAALEDNYLYSIKAKIELLRNCN